jgi:hypothetical protein
MKRLCLLLLIAMVAALTGCASNVDRSLVIESELASGIRVDAYRTWKFAREAEYPETRIEALDEPAFRTSVGNQVISDLAAKGFTKVDANPDFVMMIQFMTESQYDQQKMDDIYKGYDMATFQMTSKDYWQDGHLYVFAMDPKTGKQMWSSHAHARLDQDTSTEHKQKQFVKVLAAMLEDFPTIKK